MRARNYREVKGQPYTRKEFVKGFPSADVKIPASHSHQTGSHLLCLLIKRNWDTFQVLKSLARQLGISPKQIQIAGIKDAKAVTAQYITIDGVKPEDVKGVRIRDVGKSILKAIKEYLSDGRVFSVEKPKFQKYNLYLTKVVYGDISWRVKDPMATLSPGSSFKTINETEVLNFSCEAVGGKNVQPVSLATLHPLILWFICFAFKRRVQRVLRSLKAYRSF